MVRYRYRCNNYGAVNPLARSHSPLARSHSLTRRCVALRAHDCCLADSRRLSLDALCRVSVPGGDQRAHTGATSASPHRPQPGRAPEKGAGARGRSYISALSNPRPKTPTSRGVVKNPWERRRLTLCILVTTKSGGFRAHVGRVQEFPTGTKTYFQNVSKSKPPQAQLPSKYF